MKTTLRLSGALAALVAAQAFAAPCPTRSTAFPTDDWAAKPVDTAAKAAQIKALEDYAFTLQGADADREGFRTNSLIIVKNGVIVYEKYARGFVASNRHVSWSVAKSISSALIGIAVREGTLKLDDSICTVLTEWQGTDKCDITVKHAITFATGLGWQEEYEDATYQVSSPIAMLYGTGRRDQLKFILDHKLTHAPGSYWSYSTGDAQLASAIAKRALQPRFGPEAFWKLLFEPIGMKRVTFEEDIKGTPQGGSMVFATPRDFAKFGYLFLNDGCWDGVRVMPEGWVKASVTPSEAFVASAREQNETPSGYSWWLNKPIPSQNKPRPWADLPEDTYAALGHWGQRIIVVPSEDVVIVRTGDDRKAGSIPVNDLAKFALEVVR